MSIAFRRMRKLQQPGSLVSTKPVDQYPLELLFKVTEDFSEKFVVHRGTYSSYFLVCLPSKEPLVARKLVCGPWRAAPAADFQREVEQLGLSCLHPNISRIVGSSAFHDVRVILYEALGPGIVEHGIIINACNDV